MNIKHLDKGFFFIFLIIFSQLLLIEFQIPYIIENFSNKSFDDYLFVVLINVIFGVFSIIFFYKHFISLQKEEKNKELQQIQYEESQRLIRTLRTQIHDFRNQLQVMRMMAQIGKKEEIINYIDESNLSMDSSSNIINHVNNSAIAALLLSYSIEAKNKRGINFEVEVDVDFGNFSLSSVKITRILGNIIRNAIEILEQKKEEERAIHLTMWENPEEYCFLIWNNGPFIPIDLQDEIFKAGFSTKQSTGLGLVIVKELVNELHGSIQLKSDAEIGTEFKIIIPKKAPPKFEFSFNLL